ncbi:hypothetical protein PLESTB_001405500 [Pleodorina starrii]|uniref:Gag protein n=1 Tax=Pleodorina starrii TaxID=330485 RepID=A0A9W6F752_9CHLO|nr:hypothetical protein PLESTB_001405500 [Pleodorina starrii]
MAAELSTSGMPIFMGGGAKALADFKIGHKRFVALKSFQLKDGKVPPEAECNLAKASLAGGAVLWFEKEGEPKLAGLAGEAMLKKFWELLEAKYAEPAPHERIAFQKMKMGWIGGKPAEEDPLTFYARFACDAAVMKAYFPERQMLSIFINALPSSLHDKVKGHADGLPAPVDLEAVAQYAYNVYNSYQADNLLDTETFLMTTSTRAGGNNRPPPPYCKGCDSKSTDPQDHRRSCWVGHPAQARPDWKPCSRELFAVWEKIKEAGGRQQAQRALVTRGEEAWEDFATALVNSVVGETTGGRQQPPRVLVTRGEGAWKGGATRQ